MNDQVWGADPDELDRLARLFGEDARRVDTITKKLSAALRSTPWEGRAADHFRADWSRSHVSQLRQASAFLAEGERRLHDQARQQRNASSAETSGGALGGGVLGLAGAALSLLRDYGVTRAISIGWQFTEKAHSIVGLGNTYFDMLQLGRKVPLKDLQDLVPIKTPIEVAFAAQDAYQSFDAFRHGNIDGGVRSAIDVGWAIAGTVPIIGLSKGAFDMGWEIGLVISRTPIMKAAMADSANEVVAYAQAHGHSADLGTRYDGVGGAVNMARDVSGAFVSGLVGSLR